MTIDGKTYSDKTDSNGYAKITTSVALGKYIDALAAVNTLDGCV